MRPLLTLALLLAFVFVFGQEEKDSSRSAIYEIPQNGVILTTDYVFSLTIGYQLITPINAHMASYHRLGFGYTGESGSDATVNGELSMLYGTKWHFAEVGVGFYGPLTDKAGLAVFPNLSYRYMGPKGFNLKVGGRLGFYPREEDTIGTWEGPYGLWPVLQVGYIYYL